MRKFFTIFCFSILSFFLFSYSVSAYTSNFNLNDELWEALDNVDEIKVVADAYMINNPSYTSYIIYYSHSHNQSVKYIVYVRVAWDFYISSNGLQLEASRTLRCPYDFTTSTMSCSNNSDNYISPYIANEYNTLGILYSSKPINIGVENSSVGDVFNWTYNSDTYSITSNGTIFFPSLTELHDIFFPPNNPSVLESFVSLAIDKLSYICDFFTSDVIYLTIFAIFIFYYVIFLFRRLI